MLANDTTARPLIGVFGSRTGEEEIAALVPSVREGWMGLGPRVTELEEEFSRRLGVGFVMTDSGSNALHLAVAALDLPAGSDIVLPSFTWVACANAVMLAGHRPVWADVELTTQNVTPETVERALTPRTRAVMVVHYAGLPVDVDGIAALGVPVIEDAAHAVDASIDGRRCGALGDVAILSFDSVKNLASPDGGGVASPRPEVIERARRLRYCGVGAAGSQRAGRQSRWWEHDVLAPFPRALPNDVSASVALAQLDRLEDNQRRRTEVWEAYDGALGALDWLELPPPPPPGVRHGRFTYLVRVGGGRRDALAHHLLEHGIYSTLRYPPLHRQPVFGTTASLPATEELAEQGLNLPLHPRLTDEEVERILEAIHCF